MVLSRIYAPYRIRQKHSERILKMTKELIKEKLDDLRLLALTLKAQSSLRKASRMDDANGLEAQALVERLLGYQLRTGYDVQTGVNTNAPSVVWADADYEVGDGTCGLHETQKPANEPAIPYVRFDALTAALDEIERLREALAVISKSTGQGSEYTICYSCADSCKTAHEALKGTKDD